MRRIAIHVAVLALHAGIFMTLLMGSTWHWHAPPARKDERQDTLKIRFIELATPRPRTMPALARRATGGTRHDAPTVKPVAAPVQAIAPKPAPATDTAAATVAIPAPSYIAGGPLLRRAVTPRPVPLPGSAVAIVPGIRLVDPRSQGVAGAVRALQALFGVPDPHCVDVDAWRTLSTQELLDRHISPAQVQRTAEHYRCFPRDA
jgi:hypothetical protein